MIRDYGFTLGIQLMIGLPGDTMEKCIFSAREAVKIGPEIARLYPTVVIRDTALYDACVEGRYTPLAEEEAVLRCKAMYEILEASGINIIRVGLKSSDIMSNETAFHPAFRQLVEGRIARERMEEQLAEFLQKNNGFSSAVLFMSNEKCYNNMFGHGAANRRYFEEKYPQLTLGYAVNPALKDNEYLLKKGDIK